MPPADASIYRAAFEASPNGLAVCALDGTLLFRNAAMLDILSRLFADPDKTLEDFLSRSLRGKFPFHPFHRENGSFCVPVDLPDGRRSHFTFTLFAERERERESLTYRTNTSNTDSFSLISYIYRKIPEPEPDRFYRLSSLVAYPFSYPFFASRLLFPQEYTVVIENKNFSEKISLFSDVFLFVLRTELLLTMCPTWSAGVFFIYDHILLSSLPDALPRIRAPPLAAPYSGQMPEASPGAALAVMRDAHVLNSSPTRLKRTFH